MLYPAGRPVDDGRAEVLHVEDDLAFVGVDAPDGVAVVPLTLQVIFERIFADADFLQTKVVPCPEVALWGQKEGPVGAG